MEMQMVYKLEDKNFLFPGSEHSQLMVVSVMFKAYEGDDPTVESGFLNSILNFNFPSQLDEEFVIRKPLDFL
jgi:hypothetical protein